MVQLSASPVQYLLIFMSVMSVFLFVLMAVDKGKARRGAWRISEKTLFVFALLGGAIGGSAGMFLFRHKTRHWTFRLAFPLLAILQIALCVYLFLKS